MNGAPSGEMSGEMSVGMTVDSPGRADRSPALHPARALHAEAGENAAARIAEHLDARRVRTGRWIARCPAHADRAPSLTVAEGRDGRVLLHCFAGCSLAAILRSAGLTMQQLFAPSPSLSPAGLAKAQALRAQQRAEEAARRRRERLRIERTRLQLCDLYQSAGELAHTLALLPNEAPGAEALAACYHATLTEQRRLERELAAEPGEFE